MTLFWGHDTYFLRCHHYMANLQSSVSGSFKDLNLDDDAKCILLVLLLQNTLSHFQMMFEMAMKI